MSAQKIYSQWIKLSSSLSSRPDWSLFRIFKNRNYQLYFSGQLISMSGVWMQSVAQQWLIYRMTESAYLLGMINFCTQLPAFLLSPIAGALADRADRRKILIIAQIVELVQALTLAILVVAGTVQVWQLFVMAVILGCVNAFDMITRHAFAVDMVGKADLPAAISLNSVLMNGSRIIGPAIAGLSIGVIGEAGCFAVNGLSCIPVVIGLWLMNIKPRKFEKSSDNFIRHIWQGMKYTRKHLVIFRLLILSGFFSFLAVPFNVLLPVFAKVILHGDAKTLAWLTGAMGVGAICGSLSFHKSNDTTELKRKLTRDVALCGLSILALGISKSLVLSFFALFGIGYFMMSVFPAMNNAIQFLVDDSMRGRVMSLYTMTFLGTMPFGCLLLGWLSDRLSAPTAMMSSGAATVSIGIVLTLRNYLRSNYRESLAYER